MGLLLPLVAPAPRALAAIGPDSFGYTADSVPFTFEDISGSGTRILAGVDDAFVPAPIGFPFSFYGGSRPSLFVSSNGILTFDSPSPVFFNQNFSGPVFLDLPTIAPLWDDWQTLFPPRTDAVYFQTLGSPGARRFVVQWNRVEQCCSFFAPPGAAVTFQAVLFEGSNEIEFRYLDTDTGNAFDSFGASATVGIRDRAGNTNGRFLQWSFNQPVIRDRTAIRFRLGPGPPASLTLEPKAAVNTVDSEHCVTATVEDANGNPVPGVSVQFKVSGSVNTSGSATTDANGQATFCYQGPPLPGQDVIEAFADTNNNGVQDAGEPGDRATKTWVVPQSTEGCKVTQGGRITADNGDKATFGGNAHGSEPEKGQEQYRDHGPVTPMNVHSINVLAVVCSRDLTQADIFGQATIDGSGSFDYRIEVKDLGEPGVGTDTYRIMLSNGYDSGEHVLEGGNVQIHKQ